MSTIKVIKHGAKKVAPPKTLNIAQVAKAFKVTPLCIKHWRYGDTQKYSKMPCRRTKVGKTVRVSFDPAAVKTWAKKHGLSVRL